MLSKPPPKDQFLGAHSQTAVEEKWCHGNGSSTTRWWVRVPTRDTRMTEDTRWVKLRPYSRNIPDPPESGWLRVYIKICWKITQNYAKLVTNSCPRVSNQFPVRLCLSMCHILSVKPLFIVVGEGDRRIDLSTRETDKTTRALCKHKQSELHCQPPWLTSLSSVSGRTFFSEKK